MLSLTRLFLHHWHRFYATVIDIDGGLCLTGPDEADAAAVLDGLQLALVGDPARVRFQATRYGFTHDLDSYARGRLDEDKWQRPGSTVSYLAVEFTNTANDSKTTFGLCIETGPRLPHEITWFTLAEGLNPNTFVTKGRPLPRIELKPLLRNWRGAHYYEKALDYQTELLNLLGGLDESFFDLFQRALHYQPVRRADEFASLWFFDEHPIDLTRLRRMRERLGQLRAEHDRAEKLLAALQPIVKGQGELRRLTDLRDGQTLLVSLLRTNAASRRVLALESQISTLQSQLANLQSQLASTQKTYADLDLQLRETERLEFEHGLAHRRSILQGQQKYATLAADTIRQRWASLQRQLRSESDHLRPLLGSAALAQDEMEALKNWLDALDAAGEAPLRGTAPESVLQSDPPPPILAEALGSAIPKLVAAGSRLHAERARLADQITHLQSQLSHLQSQLETLAQSTQTVPAHVVRVQEFLAPVIGKKPPLLFEFIEVTDPRWQNAVEAVLGPNRFHAIVSATWFNAARAGLNKVRAAQDLKDADVHDPTQLYNRPALPNSLATKIATEYPDLRAYLDTALGDIICVESESELRQHQRAITPNCVFYSGWSVQAIPFVDYQPLVIGKNAARLFEETRQKQIAILKSQISALQTEITNHQSRLTDYHTQLANLSHAYSLAAFRQALNGDLDERPARNEAAGYETELRALDTTPIVEYRKKAEGLQAALAQQGRARDDLLYRIASVELELRQLNKELSTARVALDESKSEVASVWNQFSHLVAAAEEALPPHLKTDDLTSEMRLVEQREKDFDKKLREERQRLVEAISALNAVYQLSPREAWLGDPNDPLYAEAHARLTSADLPRLQAQIASAEQDIEEELRDHILRPLRERLTAVHHTLDRINDTLIDLESPYRLHAEPAQDMKEFYFMILDRPPAQPSTPEGSAQPKDAVPPLARFYDILTTSPVTHSGTGEPSALRSEGAGLGPGVGVTASRLTDYRRYLNFAIETRSADGSTAHLATADGDAQLAFYLAITASFAQAYRIRGDRAGRPCIRLLPFGAAFARMEAALIAPTLDLFKRLGLQLAAAAPLERSDYLIAGLPTIVVLTPLPNNTLLAEPYRNYHALPAVEQQKT